MKGKRILVTGGAGYLGSVVTAALLARDLPVRVLDNFTFTDAGIESLRRHPSLEVIEGDIRDREAVRRAMMNASAVIHLAAVANDPSGELDPSFTRSVNYDAYAILLEEADRSGVARFLNASSFSVYGIATDANIDESHPLNPLKEYSKCKARSEELVRAQNGRRMTTTSLRCATICGYSPRMRFDLIANTLLSHALTRRRIEVWGGDQQRPHIDIRDLCDFFLALLDAPSGVIGGEVFNAGGINLSILEIARAAKDVVGDAVTLAVRPPRDDERSYHVSSEKLARMLDLRATRTIRDAMHALVTAYRAGLWRDPEDPLHHNVRRMAAMGIGSVGVPIESQT